MSRPVHPTVHGIRGHVVMTPEEIDLRRRVAEELSREEPSPEAVARLRVALAGDELCECGHVYSDHPEGGRCTGRDSYEQQCECPSPVPHTGDADESEPFVGDDE
jgi:hypothetical protein